jgi:magnesium transporter
MIAFYGNSGVIVQAGLPSAASPALPEGTLWIDLVDATEAETSFVETAAGLRLPSLLRISEIETSSRQSVEGDRLQMSSPVLFRDGDRIETTFVGFVLTPRLLITLRSENLKSFDDFAVRLRSSGVPPAASSFEALLGLLDAIVDHMADGMEAAGADLDRVSRRIFDGAPVKRDGRSAKIEADLQQILQIIGRSGETASRARDSLLGLNRLTAFLAASMAKRPDAAGAKQLDILHRDITSLTDYENQLTDKIQFLLDSTLGFINIEQNRTFKLLTVISVIGIPPTFVVGLYGMNFKNMPEYDWSFGYQWGLAMVVLSIIVPVVWLRRRGWL